MRQIKQLFTEELSTIGFKREKDWYYKNDEVIIVVNIQKSNYGQTYFLNVAVWCNQISTELAFPKEHKCHLRFRAEKLLPNIPNELNPINILDIEKKDNDRLEKIKRFITPHFCDLLNKLKNLDSIRTMYGDGALSGTYIYRELKSLLSKV